MQFPTPPTNKGCSPEIEEVGAARLVREVQEETGLTVTDIKHFLGGFDYVSSSGKATRQLNFLSETNEGTIKLSPAEHQNFLWIPLAEISATQLNISQKTRKILVAIVQ